MPKLCKTCDFWTANNKGFACEHSNLGSCSHKAFVEGASGDPVPDDGLVYSDWEDYSASLQTGMNFGCIHQKERP